MSRMILPVAVVGLAAAVGLAAQTEPVPPAPPAPPVRSAPPSQVAPWPVAPWPVMPPAPPAAPAPPYAGRMLQAPGMLFAPPAASQSYLGVHLMDVSEKRAGELAMKEAYGVEIMSVAPGSPAEDAGVRKGDVITRYGGQRVEGQEQLVRLVRETPVGRQVELTVYRGGSEVNLPVEIGERKVAPTVLFNCGDEPCEIHIPDIKFRSFDFDIPKPRMVTQSRLLGAELESIEGQLAEHFGVKEGLLVRSVDANSPAARASLKAGDVIVEVAGKTVRDAGQIREAIRNVDASKPVALGVVRNRSRVVLEMEPQGADTNSQSRPGRRVRTRAADRF